MSLAAAPQTLTPVASRGAWKPIQRALVEGSSLRHITLSDPLQGEAVASALRAAASRNPWLLSLSAADPHRVLRAAGIVLQGGALERFDRQQSLLGWGAKTAEFESVARAPSRLGTPRLNGSLTTNGTAPTPAGARSAQPTRWTLNTAVDRIDALTQSTVSTISLSSTGTTSHGAVPTTEEGYSHAADVDYTGITIPWDVVVQIHESFLRRQYDVVFLTQILAGIFGGAGSENVIDFRFTFESWLFLFIRCDLVIDVVDNPPEVTLDGAGSDEVGVRFRVTATSYSRWMPDDEWEETDQFSGTFTRYGTLVKKTPITLAGTDFRRTWAADLANGWTAIELDEGADEGRELLLDSAVNAYITQELPLLPVTPSFSVSKPLITYPTSAAFTTSGSSDRRALSLCFHENAATFKESMPFRSYILDHGRNFAVGVSIGALQKEVVGGLDLPMTEGSVSVETVTITGGSGRLHVRSEGKALGIGFSHTADLLLKLEQGQLVAEVDDSTLNLPWWLWALNVILIPFVGVSGFVVTAIANVLGSNIVGNTIEGLLDLSALQDAASMGSDSGGVTTAIQRVEVNPFGVFLKGDIEIDTTALL